MTRSRRVVVAGSMIALLLLSVGPAEAQFRDLAQRIPSTANALVLINVDKVHRSPIAVLENWKDQHEKAFASGGMKLPPKARQYALASQLDFEFMEPLWEIAVMDLSQAPSMSTLAQRNKGTADTVEGLAAVALPNDAYVVQFGPKSVGAMAPANRQNVARWVRQSKAKSKPSVSPYLQEALGYSEDAGTEIILALDLTDVFTQKEIANKLKDLKALDGRDVDLEQLSRVLSSIRGVMLGITMRQKPFGKIKVDFGDDASMMSGYAKPLLLEVLGNRGAMIDDFGDWKTTVQGKRVSIEGHLSQSGMRRVFSVLDAPTSALNTPETKVSGTSSDQTNLKAYASQQYFHSVTGMLDDLQESAKKSKTFAQNAVWFDKYARKIDRLSMVNVDPELLDYGAQTSQALRSAASAVRGVGIRSGAREAQIYPTVTTGGYRYGRYGAYGGYYDDRSSVNSQRRAVRAEERGAGATSARDILEQIANATAGIRRTMTERYQVDF